MYELYNNVDGYQAEGTLEEMKKLGRDMIADDKENGIDWLQPYWIEFDGETVYRFRIWKKQNSNRR